MLETDGFDESEGTVFRDLIMLTLAGFVTMVILMIPHLNPPAAEGETPAAGNVVVEARWADGLPADVDLWVQGPGDQPVGYSRKSGRVFDLLRDDLGIERDETELNYEFAFSRGAPAGEYTVNLHLFNARRSPLPLAVTVTISLRHPESARVTRITSRKVVLRRENEEITVARFRLDARGRLEPGSLHDLPKPLRTAG
ncbi:hypothetical protein SAMN05216257_104194 [Meinhardsimonia xiamenensis]|jgi:hypothetical protein|uniref:Uncharacterized protein n=1 Tax=Meinhardsimonia xiamenensis TaxID=990712 RepID=A0A1G9E876_9RHOB|nr:hypothetical protein [Meinhardsimonia xiamenensis]PRX33884.1 hypothetical protein LV81_02320 [Meinhardsimonia xiamenensis]SDK72363.1 hypothetical protein SAMN05216257_104194 [Meinhardsimonia xiamenensis]